MIKYKSLRVRNVLIPFLVIILSFHCTEANETGLVTDDNSHDTDLPLNKIKLPDGFKISIFASGVINARSMCLSPEGTLFVGNRGGNKVYALRDTDGDFKADEKYIVASGLKLPNGVAIRNGDLYVAEVSRILKFPDIENSLQNPPDPIVIYDDFPTNTHHGWKYIAFGPDDKLYVPVGAPCNICNKKKEIFASITRMNPDGSGLEIFARGIRNTVGFTWHPDTKELWFTDNGRDMLGDDIPPCELNRAPQKGMHFGYPFCHGGNLADPQFGDDAPCNDFIQPVQNLGPHVAPLGLKFYTGDMFPSRYKKQIFIAEHGSWNRSTKIGYRISLVKLNGNKSLGYETFAEGWLDEKEQQAWGRPVDVLIMPDGSMLVSDDLAGVIYRISYEG
ncbi:sorbosone dehydrogenase family protein [Fulvivirgaceae bacterium BMA10]|uniref:Sorbosone dehydrogenase family protein n=1 Tax=Splendidivirga corallicola TaxID=3051826 RepID=A0ABT8KSI7_9BACT|nr:sorbosone dehydrogenase family protein [Fulvivirgaceae bacterium BMA10]